MKFKVIELFGGIGACTAALKRIGIDFEVVDYVEIDKYAVASYNAINGTSFEPQDVTEWDKDLVADLIMHGSPCQDFSIAGRQAGGDEGSGTRSSLMYETIRIVEKVQPRYVIWENVRNVLSKTHKHNFDKYLSRMQMLGYHNYWDVLNAKDYGIPQNRERVFVVSVRGFVFPEGKKLALRLKDMLEKEVDEKYFLSQKGVNYVTDKTRLEKNYTDINADAAITITAKGQSNWTGSFVTDDIGIQKVINGTQRNRVYGENGIAASITIQHEPMRIAQETDKPKLVGGVSDKLWGEKQYHQQDRVYSTDAIAMSHPAQMPGGSYLYAVEEDTDE